jgi:hypothetical protein
MKVKCIKKFGKDLSQDVIDAGQLRTTIYPIDLGEEFKVYGIASINKVLYYLIVKASVFDVFFDWNPAELFQIIDNTVPSDWKYKFIGYTGAPHNLNAIFGYPELLELEHYVGLIEYHAKDLKILTSKANMEIQNVDLSENLLRYCEHGIFEKSVYKKFSKTYSEDTIFYGITDRPGKSGWSMIRVAMD